MVDATNGPELESGLPDLRDLRVGEGADPEVTAALEARILPQDGVSAFNSSI
jgi:hypothetical protein